MLISFATAAAHTPPAAVLEAALLWLDANWSELDTLSQLDCVGQLLTCVRCGALSSAALLSAWQRSPAVRLLDPARELLQQLVAAQEAGGPVAQRACASGERTFSHNFQVGWLLAPLPLSLWLWLMGSSCAVDQPASPNLQPLPASDSDAFPCPSAPPSAQLVPTRPGFASSSEEVFFNGLLWSAAVQAPPGARRAKLLLRCSYLPSAHPPQEALPEPAGAAALPLAGPCVFPALSLHWASPAEDPAPSTPTHPASPTASHHLSGGMSYNPERGCVEAIYAAWLDLPPGGLGLCGAAPHPWPHSATAGAAASALCLSATVTVLP